MSCLASSLSSDKGPAFLPISVFPKIFDMGTSLHTTKEVQNGNGDAVAGGGGVTLRLSKDGNGWWMYVNGNHAEGGRFYYRGRPENVDDVRRANHDVGFPQSVEEHLVNGTYYKSSGTSGKPAAPEVRNPNNRVW